MCIWRRKPKAQAEKVIQTKWTFTKKEWPEGKSPWNGDWQQDQIKGGGGGMVCPEAMLTLEMVDPAAKVHFAIELELMISLTGKPRSLHPCYSYMLLHIHGDGARRWDVFAWGACTSDDLRLANLLLHQPPIKSTSRVSPVYKSDIIQIMRSIKVPNTAHWIYTESCLCSSSCLQSPNPTHEADLHGPALIRLPTLHRFDFEAEEPKCTMISARPVSQSSWW